MQKILIAGILSLFSLASCGQWDPIANNITTQSGANTQANKDATKKNPETRKREDIFKNFKPEEQAVINEFESAYKNSDDAKKQEMMKKLKELEITKKAEVDILMKKGDTLKAIELKKSMRIFGELKTWSGAGM